MPRQRSWIGPARLKKRADFLKAAQGRKAHLPLFSVQAASRIDSESSGARVGFTATKKLGGAVERNRIKRRLRALVRVESDLGLQPGHDYVIVARQDVLSASVGQMVAQLRAALRKIERGSRPAPRSVPSQGEGR